MSPSFQPFQLYASAAEAAPLLQALAAQGIAVETSLDAGQLAFNPSLANQQQFTQFSVKLQPADFEAAREVQEQVNEQQLRELPSEHYLYQFSNAELFDILARPDEWSSFDVTLARVLLTQRGQPVTPDTLRTLRQRRAAELARPEAAHPGWLWAGYLLALLGGLLGLLMGAHLYWHRRSLPDGRRAYAYSSRVRMHGLRMLLLAVIVFGVLLWLRLSA